MEILLWSVIVLQRLIYIYLPVVCFLGMILTLASDDSDNIIPNPYLGIIKVSKKKGVLIWSIRLVLLGATLFDYANWYYYGVNPFIQM